MEKAYFNYTGKDQKGKVIAEPTASALYSFCRQEPEFSQAIEQSGKSFTECIDAIAQTLGTACSDIDVYAKAVKFYFSGATINVSMTINMSGEIEAEMGADKIPYVKPEIIEAPPVTVSEPVPVQEEPKPKKITLDLDNLLDF